MLELSLHFIKAMQLCKLYAKKIDINNRDNYIVCIVYVSIIYSTCNVIDKHDTYWSKVKQCSRKTVPNCNTIAGMDPYAYLGSSRPPSLPLPPPHNGSKIARLARS